MQLNPNPPSNLQPSPPTSSISTHAGGNTSKSTTNSTHRRHHSHGSPSQNNSEENQVTFSALIANAFDGGVKINFSSSINNNSTHDIAL
ncbi:hypothetical protein Pmani_027163 [Petrolisthes manimaculis]|uniref:Uncharacterized protein n=1 Tax=Petrolisthes manimaculis TaxID=1843537 RepID=A0AAE1P212_9EUCA|nr:hypothetical protein Pmani_027163 [Petrolisthes manimaculis]